MTDAQDRPKTVWPGLVYRDAEAAIRFLEALGFERRIVVPGEGPGVVRHSQLAWPEGGAVMVSTAEHGDGPFSRQPTGGSVYVMTDDPEAVHARAVSAGARIVRELQHEDYGSYGFSIADPEGVFWSFGTYRGE